MINEITNFDDLESVAGGIETNSSRSRRTRVRAERLPRIRARRRDRGSEAPVFEAPSETTIPTLPSTPPVIAVEEADIPAPVRRRGFPASAALGLP